jgi:hypothetical protein
MATMVASRSSAAQQDRAAGQCSTVNHQQQQQQQQRLYRCEMGRESGVLRAQQCPLGCWELVCK